MRRLISVGLCAALQWACRCPPASTDGSTDAMTPDASMDAMVSSDGGLIDGGVLMVFQSCFAQGGTRFVSQLGSFRYGICLQLLFLPDAGSLWPEVSGPPGFGLRDARYSRCTDQRFMNDGGLVQTALVPTSVRGRLEWLAMVNNTPVAVAIIDGGVVMNGVSYNVEAEGGSVDLFCPGD